MTSVRSLPYGWSVRLGLLLAVYMFLVPISAVVVAVLHAANGSDVGLGFLLWPVPWIFPVASLLVLWDAIRVAAADQQLDKKAPMFVIVAALLTVGSSFALTSHHRFDAVPILVCASVLVVLVLLGLTAHLRQRHLQRG